MTEDLTEDEDDGQDESQVSQIRMHNLSLDNNIDLPSPFLHSMVSDERLVPNPNSLAPAAVITHREMRNREATEE